MALHGPKKGIDPSQDRAHQDRMSIASILNDPRDEMNVEHLRIDAGEDIDRRDEYVKTEDDTEDGASETLSSASSSSGRRRRFRNPRPPCKKYEPEQGYFIWYHRTDLEECWDDVEREFTLQFGDERRKGGLQCKFYRLLDEEGVEKVREQARSGRRRRGDRIGKFGVVQRTTRRYPWM